MLHTQHTSHENEGRMFIEEHADHYPVESADCWHSGTTPLSNSGGSVTQGRALYKPKVSHVWWGERWRNSIPVARNGFSLTPADRPLHQLAAAARITIPEERDHALRDFSVFIRD
jgi:hypothetical protein